tara:strand:+ start:583 stop:897 length:315 start_codon:yes stop_codon:yes gene_type:complete
MTNAWIADALLPRLVRPLKGSVPAKPQKTCPSVSHPEADDGCLEANDDFRCCSLRRPDGFHRMQAYRLPFTAANLIRLLELDHQRGGAAPIGGAQPRMCIHSWR